MTFFLRLNMAFKGFLGGERLFLSDQAVQASNGDSTFSASDGTVTFSEPN